MVYSGINNQFYRKIFKNQEIEKKNDFTIIIITHFNQGLQ